MLWIQKLIVEFFSPLPFCLFVSILGMALLWTKKYQKTGKLWILIGLGTLILCGYGVLNSQLQKIENKYDPLKISSIPQVTLHKIKYIVVLGSGHVSDPRLPVTSQINGDSLRRLIEGIRIYRNIPNSKLLLSGGPGFDRVPNAEVMSKVALAIGVPKNDLVLENRPMNTEEEARLIKQQVLKNPFVLVTSSAHMPRTMAIFKELNMNPIPAPTDFIFKSSGKRHAGSFFPNCHNICITKRLIYEFLGSMWLTIKGLF